MLKKLTSADLVAAGWYQQENCDGELAWFNNFLPSMLFRIMSDVDPDIHSEYGFTFQEACKVQKIKDRNK